LSYPTHGKAIEGRIIDDKTSETATVIVDGVTLMELAVYGNLVLIYLVKM
jgi:hypothetical protein